MFLRSEMPLRASHQATSTTHCFVHGLADGCTNELVLGLATHPSILHAYFARDEVERLLPSFGTNIPYNI